MAHDPVLQERLAELLEAMGAEAEPKRMFGGVAFMVAGNMCVGITNRSNLMVRFDPSRHAEIAEWRGALPMTYGKGEMKGFLFVDQATVADRKGMERWVSLALAHVRTLPPKALKKGASRSVGKAAAPKKGAGIPQVPKKAVARGNRSKR